MNNIKDYCKQCTNKNCKNPLTDNTPFSACVYRNTNTMVISCIRERHYLTLVDDKVFLTDLISGDTIEILNYKNVPIVWDVYGEEFVYDDCTEIEYKYIGKRNDFVVYIGKEVF